MFKNTALEFLYGWARYMLAGASLLFSLVSLTSGAGFAAVLLLAAAALFWQWQGQGNPERWEGAKVAAGLALFMVAFLFA